MPKIFFIGFSYVGYGDQSSIGNCLNELFSGEFGVVEISYGGLSINSLSALILNATTDVGPDDFIVLDLATSYYSTHGHSVADALPYVEDIVNTILRVRTQKILMLNMYRPDLRDDDCVVQAINNVCTKFDIAILDLKSTMRAMDQAGECSTTDGVHPDLTSRQYIASQLFNAIRVNSIDIKFRDTRPEPLFCYHDLSHDGQEHYLYEGRGKKLNSRILLSGQSFEIDLNKISFIEGLFFLFGPETGFISIQLDDGTPFDLISFDENSYYRRVGYRQIGKTSRKILISVDDRTRDIALKTPTVLLVASRREFICGLSIRRT